MSDKGIYMSDVRTNLQKQAMMLTGCKSGAKFAAMSNRQLRDFIFQHKKGAKLAKTRAVKAAAFQRDNAEKLATIGKPSLKYGIGAIDPNSREGGGRAVKRAKVHHDDLDERFKETHHGEALTRRLERPIRDGKLKPTQAQLDANDRRKKFKPLMDITTVGCETVGVAPLYSGKTILAIPRDKLSMKEQENCPLPKRFAPEKYRCPQNKNQTMSISTALVEIGNTKADGSGDSVRRVISTVSDYSLSAGDRSECVAKRDQRERLELREVLGELLPALDSSNKKAAPRFAAMMLECYPTDSGIMRDVKGSLQKITVKVEGEEFNRRRASKALQVLKLLG